MPKPELLPRSCGQRTCPAQSNRTLSRSSKNYPNPFNPATNIRFSLAESGETMLSVYNIQGQRVATLVNGSLPAGQHTVRFGRLSPRKRNLPHAAPGGK